jgi:hypothetical protein
MRELLERLGRKPELTPELLTLALLEAPLLLRARPSAFPLRGLPVDSVLFRSDRSSVTSPIVFRVRSRNWKTKPQRLKPRS